MAYDLVIRADAGLQIGTGHVRRCLALAEPWLQSGSQVTLVSSNLPSEFTERTQTSGIKMASLRSLAGTPEDARELLQITSGRKAPWVVVDGYQFGSEYQLALKKAGAKVLFFDDFGHAEHYSADFILNQNLGASEKLYSNRAPQTKLLLGTRFVQLRGEFMRWRGWQPTIPQRAQKILVTLGGSDRENVTLKAIRALETISNGDATVVVGSSNPHRKVLAKATQNLARIHLVENPANMPEIMSRHDLAIAAGGTTAWELAFMGLPALILVLAENQRSNGEQLQAAGVARNLGFAAHVSTEKIAEEISKLAADSVARAAMSHTGRQLIDGLGNFRAWFHLNEDALHLRRAATDDARLIWQWANDRTAREVSFSSEPICWEVHLDWFQKKLSDPNCFLWIAEDENGGQIGMVRFDLESETVAISGSLDKNQRGRNRGALLIWSACRKLFRETQVEAVDAFIKPNNHASIRAFRKAGLELANQTVVKNQPALRFQIKRGRLET